MVSTNGKKRIWILDGAMGTTLENLGYDISGPMWGSDLLVTNPSAVREVHVGYRDSGADIIETATYQVTLESLVSHHGLNRPDAKDLMRSSIEVAATDRDPRIIESYNGLNARIAVSLGPFGATLSPGQEYSGIYPPPYGPPAPLEVSERTQSQLNEFEDTPEAHHLASAGENALMEWHLSRLRIYSSDADTWRKVEWLAFETIPLLREIRAIRRAVGKLYEELEARLEREREASWRKKFWVTSAYPDGQHPQRTSKGERINVHAVLEALLLPTSEGTVPVPDGIGINCTHPDAITALSDDFTSQTTDMLLSEIIQQNPLFVLYPDGGAVYDTFTKMWSGDSTDAREWAGAVAKVAKRLEAAEWEGGKVWSAVIVGGCCKSSFEEIRQLRIALESHKIQAHETVVEQ